MKVDAEFAEDSHLRIPVIPTVNMNEKNMKDTIKFLSNLKHIKDIELLPYHRLGLETYERLGKVYELKDVEISDMEMLKKMAEPFTKALDIVESEKNGNIRITSASLGIQRPPCL